MARMIEINGKRFPVAQSYSSGPGCRVNTYVMESNGFSPWAIERVGDEWFVCKPGVNGVYGLRTTEAVTVIEPA